jgi:hypothetical protein
MDGITASAFDFAEVGLDFGGFAGICELNA